MNNITTILLFIKSSRPFDYNYIEEFIICINDIQSKI